MTLSIPLLAAVFLSLASFVSCQTPASDKTLMQALADIPECNKYYEFLQQHPGVQPLPPGQNYLVFCPRNEAFESVLAAPPGSKVKRDDPKVIRALAHQVALGNKVTKEVPTTSTTASTVPSPSANLTSPARSPRKRQVTSVFTSLVTVVNSLPTTTGAASTTARSSPGGSPATSTAVATSFRTSGPDPFASDPSQLTLKTLLTDPAFVNLGPGESGRMVSFNSPPSFNNTSLKLVSGLGQIINVLRGNIPFNLGMIHVTQEWASHI